MTPQEVEQIVQRELSRMRLDGDARIGTGGRFPAYRIFYKEPIAQAPGQGGSGGDIILPLGWQPIAQKISGTWKIGVWPGLLYNTLSSGGGELTVSNTLAFGQKINPADAGWTAISVPMWAVMKITFASWPAVSAQAIEFLTSAPNIIEYQTTTDGDGNTITPQLHARKILGYIPNNFSDGSPKLMGATTTGVLQLDNSGDQALDSGAANPMDIPMIFPW